MRMFLYTCAVGMAIAQVYASGNSGPNDEEDPLSSKSGSQFVSGASTPSTAYANTVKQKVPPIWEGPAPRRSTEDDEILHTRIRENLPPALVNESESCKNDVADAVKSSFTPASEQ